MEAGLLEPEYEYEVTVGKRVIGRADLAYPSVRLLIECDSARWHRNRQSFLADPRRRNRLVLAGYRVINFTWDDYRFQPDRVVAIVAAALSGPAADGSGRVGAGSAEPERRP